MNSAKFLRITRVIVAFISIVLMTGLFVDYGMTFPRIASWLAKVQFLPATMAFSLATFVGWLIVTLCFGRIYCSVACPLGIFQDICARLPRLKKVFDTPRAYHYKPARRRLRNIVLFVVVVSILLGISVITSLLDPYSIYGRFCVDILRPVWGAVINVYSSIAGAPPVRIAFASALGMTITLVTMIVVSVVAFRNGRTLCNTVCPVGTTLSFVARYAVFRFDINTDKCIQCRKCEHVCKSSCIDLNDHVVDMSRCVVCFDCLPVCPNDAIHYTYTRHQLSIPLMQKARDPLAGTTASMDDGRRTFLIAGAFAAASPIAAKLNKVTGRIEALELEQSPSSPSLPVTPPGTTTQKKFLDRCTACGLCIAHCPQKVLVPSFDQYGLLRALHPVMDYDRSWCLYNCTRCANLCPTGALRPLTLEEKHRTRIGVAHVNLDFCISYKDDVKCGACARRCPVEAIKMVQPETEGHGPSPVVSNNICIGCGACQYVCPGTPSKAILVNGLP